MSKYRKGDVVYYRNYLAEVLATAGRTRFRKTPKYLIEPYPDMMFRKIVKETELIKWKTTTTLLR